MRDARTTGCLAAVVAMLLVFAALERPAAADASYAYVSVGGEARIQVYELDLADGKLLSRSSVTVDGSPGSLAVMRERRLLYAAVRSAGSVATFRIDPASGGLALVSSAEVLGNPVYVSTDPAGKFLFTAYYGDGKAAVYPIGDDGAVIGTPVQTLTTEKNPHCIEPDASGRFVYVPNTGADSILQLRLEADSGVLAPCSTPKTTTAAGAGPRHLVLHPRGDLLYVVNEKNSSLTAYRRDLSAGDLTALQSLSTLPASYAGANTCADIEVAPSGKYVYASNRGHDSIACYAIDYSSGLLTSLGNVPTEKTPREFAIDPDGKYLIAAGQGSGRLATYRIDAGGNLRPLATYAVGAGPSWVTIVSFPRP